MRIDIGKAFDDLAQANRRVDRFMFVQLRRVDAEESLSIGLAAAVSDPEKLMNEASSVARRFADGPTVAYRATRRILHAAAASSLQAILDEEARVQGELGALPTHEEGMSAFSEKRPPDFRSLT